VSIFCRRWFANDWHLVHWVVVPQEVRAGLIIQEATSVSPEGRISPEDLGLWKDEQIEKLVQINQFIVSQHSVPDSIGACRKKSKQFCSLEWP
jgi:hypothetical protein